MEKTPKYVAVDHDVPIRTYFEFMDSLAVQLDSVYADSIDEYAIVWANRWIINKLESSDYYHQKEQGVFLEDPQSFIVLQRGDTLLIPDSVQVADIHRQLAATTIDVNIPEFKLRIIQDGKVRYTFPVRVGRNQHKYLAMAGRQVDLRTKTGTGKIIRINRSPKFINPSDNKPYFTTKRDDGKRTKLPRIPWLEPELDGHRYGQLIHPTTNPKSLGKAYSNGCIGLGEADMWQVYYHAPIGTKVVFRYDLEVVNEQGDTVLLKNIYPGYEKKKERVKIIAASMDNMENVMKDASICHCN